jgi:hypothetical protein
VGGVLVRLMGPMGLGFESLSERVGGSSLDTLDSRGMALKLDFSMTCSVESKPKVDFSKLLTIARFEDASVEDHL